MNRIVRHLALPLALALTLVALAPPAARPAHAAAGSGDTTQSDIGVYAAVGCGLGLRYMKRVGPLGELVLSATLVLCAIMVVDALFTPDSP